MATAGRGKQWTHRQPETAACQMEHMPQPLLTAATEEINSMLCVCTHTAASACLQEVGVQALAGRLRRALQRVCRRRFGFGQLGGGALLHAGRAGGRGRLQRDLRNKAVQDSERVVTAARGPRRPSTGRRLPPKLTSSQYSPRLPDHPSPAQRACSSTTRGALSVRGSSATTASTTACPPRISGASWRETACGTWPIGTRLQCRQGGSRGGYQESV